ncbi:1-phosphofructokinase family hexose kinase [Ramlibacter sp. Leaf400]|uniref:1-phosphofructokinase family hexose kinase n=1 Tax=Ramlibacter sp. Leaf400 TaxID=1736365 RepID=UPI0006F539E9|nr:1-phosphofructokinase family hexose kinase [Ramlibacter sp. Leaf400]KQT10871.1 phosphofructokinase [Ramlibacter sp. Leaf400]
MADIVTLTLNPAVDVATAVDRLVPGDKLRCAPPLVHPGGGGINVARVAARLGGDVIALYAAGGPTGELLQQLLREEELTCEALRIAGTTRENLAVQDKSTGQEFRFVLPGPALSPSEWQGGLSRCAQLAGQTSFVVASGSLPPGVPDDFHARLSSRLGPGARLVVDSSGPALKAALEAGVFAVKPSLTELRQLTGEPLDTRAEQLEACRRLVRTGRAMMVALSLGREGAMLVSAQGAWRAAGLPVTVAGTIGAGDSFVGGLVCALVRNEPPQEALRHAMAASAATVQERGTALCDAGKVRLLLQRVEVERL